ncbi:MAG: hypothetical protein R3B40_17120 [Polyangiales bacterium]|nr:hypothetical protein [Myxococcales bacterium]
MTSEGALGCAPPRDGSEGAQVEAESRRWEDLDHDARMAVMSTEVLPAARRLFQGFDAERYSSVTCATCHGEDGAERAWAMPNPSLYALYPTGSAEQQAMVRDYPEMVRFMHNHLVPEMRAILGAESYEESSHSGFACFSCHPRGGE